MQRPGCLLVSLCLCLGLVGLAGCSGERPAEAARPDVAGPVGAGPGRAHHGPGERRGRPAEDRAVAVLHAWDRRRSAAWAAQDVGALRRLYVRSSAAGDRDVALLRRYAARGIVVPELRMQVWRVQVLVQRPRRVVLRVAERLATRQVRSAGAGVRIPQDSVETRVVDLRRTQTGWRVASVRPAGS